MKTVMVDMDNVITNGIFLKHINDYLGTDYHFGDFTDYCYVQKLVNENDGFWHYMSSRDFYGDAPLLEGCYDVLEKMNRKYELYIVTTFLWNEAEDISGANLMNKYSYLKNRLPFIGPERYIFASNKKIMNFNIRIDDRMESLEGASKKLLFTAWHNKGISDDELAKQGVIRVDSWWDIGRNLLTEQEERAA